MYDISKAVHNVLSGFEADGRAPLEKPVAFTKKEDVRVAFVAVARELTNQLNGAGLQLDPPQLTALTAKLARYATNKGWQRKDNIGQLNSILPTLADAVMEKPEDLLTDLSVRGLINEHQRRSRQAAAKLHVVAREAEEPEEIALLSDPTYRIVELKTPRQLQAESAVLRHCVGTMHNSAALTDHKLGPEDPGAEKYLHYAIKIRQGESRIFSLRENGKPKATIEYDLRGQRIAQIEKHVDDRKIEGDEPFFPALCQGLGELMDHIPIGEIKGLPEAPDNQVLTRDGWWEDYAKVDLDKVLTGKVAVINETPQDELLLLCACPRLEIDVTKLGLSYLPPRVKASLYSDAKSFDAPTLVEAGDIDAPAAASFSAPMLEGAETIYAGRATSFSAPMLREVWWVWLIDATSLSLPMLQKAGQIRACQVRDFSLPMLREAEDIIALGATSFSAPMLRKAGNIYAENAASFFAPELEKVEGIRAHNATSFSVQMLREAGSIWACNATSFSAPILEKARTIEASSAASFSAPMLREAVNLLAMSSTSFSAPMLREALNIWAHKATIFDAPMLEKFECIEAPLAQRPGGVYRCGPAKLAVG